MDYLSNFEEYLHFDEKDRLVQTAIMHAQFEIIHPFLDGNGRVGRLLIPLFLYARQMLDSPMFYISAYFERNRTEYYDSLLRITEYDDWSDWIRFFLSAVITQSKVNIRKARKILELYEEMKTLVPNITGSKYAIQIIDVLFGNTVFTTRSIKNKSTVPKRSVHRILGNLVDEGIISVLHEASGRNPALYIFPALFNIVNTQEEVE